MSSTIFSFAPLTPLTTLMARISRVQDEVVIWENQRFSTTAGWGSSYPLHLQSSDPGMYVRITTQNMPAFMCYAGENHAYSMAVFHHSRDGSAYQLIVKPEVS